MMEISLTDDEAFSMSLDQIIDLQQQRKRSAAQSNEAFNIMPLVQPSTSGESSSSWGAAKSTPTSSQQDSPQIFFELENESAVKNDTDGPSFRTSRFPRSRTSLFDEFSSVASYDYPLSSGVGRAHPQKSWSFQQNKLSTIPKLMGPNFFKPYKQTNTNGKRCCSNRCQAQTRLFLLTSQLRARRRNRLENEYEYNCGRGGRGGLKRSTSCTSIQSNLSYGSQDSCSCDPEPNCFQHRSRSRSRGPQNRYPSSSRRRSRSRSRSQRWRSFPCFRKDQILTESIQEEIKQVQEKRSNQSPMSAFKCRAEDCKPTVHFTFISMNSRFLQYYE